MTDIFKSIPVKITEYWSKQSKKKKISLIALLLSIVLITVITVALISKTDYAVLYSGLSQSESGEIYQKLKESSYEVKAGKN